MFRRNISTDLIILLAATIFTDCPSNGGAFLRKLTDWKIAPTITIMTQGLNAIAVMVADDEVASKFFSTVKRLKCEI